MAQAMANLSGASLKPTCSQEGQGATGGIGLGLLLTIQYTMDVNTIGRVRKIGSSAICLVMK